MLHTQVNKNENLVITALQNGYLVAYGYTKETDPEAKNKWDRDTYVNEKSMFKTWDEVVDFIKTKELSVPAVELD
jgi:hypothetical protein